MGKNICYALYEQITAHIRLRGECFMSDLIGYILNLGKHYPIKIYEQNF